MEKKKTKKKYNYFFGTGRPPKYSSPEVLQKKIDEYFESGYDTKKVITGNKKDGFKEIEVPVLTITGLVLFLGFSNRHSFYDYEKKEKFAHTIKRARTFIENEYEKMLTNNNPTGAIFALKNFGWRDRQELEHTGKDGGPIELTNDVSKLSEKDLLALLNDKKKTG